ncbi:hypothetical protein G6F70_008040 [Rhizopus microsporus]|uniref:DUF3020 domain-containing protein n=2 Tax=Rhizopus TaxID=4842 RepID=A0A367JQ84_RHIAZ|nr:hypothetical protein G6F71_008033 [Rhizopus microsporus]RCH92066.1 hypothetical protein CU097_009926 [Rhizopus azygosporus]KAG1195696.1 hypothetical protein G6F70_008040 [Rhizopus microsporus]KAG1207529.1 hypothetical protein G6F69_007973 [Rhizopus microsporus]KAG1228327.1 hypothetical protein G6F67_007893 [Rhizopus microsporus]
MSAEQQQEQSEQQQQQEQQGQQLPTEAQSNENNAVDVTQSNPTTELNLEDPQIQQAIAQAAALMGDYSHLLANIDVGKIAATALMKNNSQVLPDPETYKKLLMTQKVRQDNRERKKRWRERNQERNKDNDLRCRVNKRAQKLFGKEDSEHKRRWIEEEFMRRRAKRLDKEQRKSAPRIQSIESTPPSTPSTPTTTPSIPLKSEEMAAFTNLLTDQNYLSILANSLNSFTQQKNPLTSQLLGILQQQQQQQETMLSQEETTSDSLKDKENAKSEIKANEYPMEVVLTLMQMNAGWRQ